MARIDSKYLTKVYKNGAYGLKNCSISVADGEFLVIVGASGSGKSTLLKVLAGTEAVSSGELYFDGILADNIPVSKRSVSMVFQEYVLYPHMTVFDNLATPLKIAGEKERSIYDKVMEALRIFNLELTADVKPKNLSGGEQQRVALAKALLKKSKLVLLDEPLSNVDEKSRWEYCGALRKMKSLLPESTFIYVTHNPKEAMFLADRIAVMEDGAILQVAPKELLLKYPEHKTVLEIMGVSNASVEDPEISLSMMSLALDGRLNENILEFANQSIALPEEYMARLLYRPGQVRVMLEIDKFSKTLATGSFSLVFEVVENLGDHVVLKIENTSFVLCRKTGLMPGEKIRLYYKIDDLILYDGDDRITCHYPLHRYIPIKSSAGERAEILGKRIKLKSSVPAGVSCCEITPSGFDLSYTKGKYAVPIRGCLDEEFINGKKLSHIAVNNADRYLSVLSGEDVSCFGKSKVWLNIDPYGLEFKK